MPAYPSGYDSPDNFDVAETLQEKHRQIHNLLNEIVVAIEKRVGAAGETDPASVEWRVEDVISDLSAHASDGALHGGGGGGTTLGSANPADLGATATPGVGTLASRQDHRHSYAGLQTDAEAASHAGNPDAHHAKLHGVADHDIGSARANHGLDSNKGAAGTTGRIYYATDVNAEKLWYDNGTAWVDLGITDRTLIAAKGDLLAGSAADTLIKKAVGAEGTVLTSRAAEPSGLAWEGTSGNNLWFGQPISNINMSHFANENKVAPAWVGATQPLTKILIRVITQSGNISAGIYNTAGTRLATTGAIACPVVGWALLTPLSIPTLTPGKYFLSLSADNAVAAFGGSTAPLYPFPASYGAQHPIPASITTPTTPPAIGSFGVPGIMGLA